MDVTEGLPPDAPLEGCSMRSCATGTASLCIIATEELSPATVSLRDLWPGGIPWRAHFSTSPSATHQARGRTASYAGVDTYLSHGTVCRSVWRSRRPPGFYGW